MKEFDICMEGNWFFDYTIKANSKEEAIEKAIEEMDQESGSIDLEHTKQWFDCEEKENTKAFYIDEKIMSCLKCPVCGSGTNKGNFN